MAGRRHARSETIHTSGALLAAMRACRHEALVAARPLRPYGETWKEIDALTAAIDRLAGHLTGNPTLFHDKGSTGQHGVLNGVVKREG